MQERQTVDHILDQVVPQILEEEPGIGRNVRAVLGIDIQGTRGGYWTLDLQAERPMIERGKTKEPKCTLSCHVDVFESLVERGSVRDALRAFTSKRIQVMGHLPTILKLESLLRAMSAKDAA